MDHIWIKISNEVCLNLKDLCKKYRWLIGLPIYSIYNDNV